MTEPAKGILGTIFNYEDPLDQISKHVEESIRRGEDRARRAKNDYFKYEPQKVEPSPEEHQQQDEHTAAG